MAKRKPPGNVPTVFGRTWSSPLPPPLLAAQLELASKHHQQGKLREAETICREILRFHPTNFDALHLLGILALQAGQAKNGLDLIDKALKINPHQVDALFNRGKALHGLMHIEAALASYDLALKHEPNYLPALCGRANLLLQTRRYDEALAGHDKALSLAPAAVELLHGRGYSLNELKRYDEALDSYDRALRLSPNFAELLFNRGNTLRELKRYDKALESFHLALRIKPDFAPALINCAAVLRTLERHQEALALYDRLLAIQPDDAVALNKRGSVLRELERYADALADFGDALRILPTFADAMINIGIVMLDLKRPEDALARFEAVLRINRDNAYALFLCGKALEELKRRDEAIHAYRQARDHGMDSEELQYVLAAIGAEAIPDISPRRYVEDLFESYADHFDEHLVDELEYRIPFVLADAIKALTPSGQLDVLDLGCGTGLCGPLLRPFARSLNGVDLSQKMIERAKKREMYDDLVCGDITEYLRAKIDTFDLVVATDVFVYFGDLSEVFRDVHRALRVGGIFGFSVEATERKDFVLRPTRRFAHSVAYLRRLASDYGFAVERMDEQMIRKDANGYLCLMRLVNR